MTKKYIDFGFITLFPLFIFVLVFSFKFEPNYLESLILVFGVPCVYLSLRDTKKIRKIATFSLLVSIPIAFIMELMAFHDKAWIVPHTVFPFRIFDFLPIEDLIWQFLTVYTILIFYEYFCNKNFKKRLSKKITLMNSVLYSLTFLTIILFVVDSPMLHISYPYLWFCIPFLVVPTLLYLGKYPWFFKTFIYTQLFFFYIHTLFEIIGLRLNHWIFASDQYLGMVSMLGQTFPVEELVFVMILGAFAALTYYEYFTNDNLNSHDAV